MRRRPRLHRTPAHFVHLIISTIRTPDDQMHNPAGFFTFVI